MALRHKSVLYHLSGNLVIVLVAVARLHQGHPVLDIVLQALFLGLAAEVGHCVDRLNDEVHGLELLIRKLLRIVLLPFHFLFYYFNMIKLK